MDLLLVPPLINWFSKRLYQRFYSTTDTDIVLFFTNTKYSNESSAGVSTFNLITELIMQPHSLPLPTDFTDYGNTDNVLFFIRTEFSDKFPTVGTTFKSNLDYLFQL